VRPFQATDEEYQATVAIHNAVWPDERPLTVATCRQNDDEWPAGAFHQRFVVEDSGAIVAHGSCYEDIWRHLPKLIHIDFQVQPDQAGRGVEDLLYNAILAHIQQQRPRAETLATRMREDRLAQVQFLLDQGFQPALRALKSVLTIADFDPAPFQAIAEHVTEQGIRCDSLAELCASTPDWPQTLHQLQAAIRQDVPSVEPRATFTFADFERMVLDDPALDSNAWFIAVDTTQTGTDGGELWVGQSNLWLNDPTNQRLDTGLTGVIRSHRRCGIATALKLRTIDYAQRRGARTIVTSNEENNPMYQINLRLGFQPEPAWVKYRKQLNERGK
jgi:GNAT superfamily N-acetyltransferase